MSKRILNEKKSYSALELCGFCYSIDDDALDNVPARLLGILCTYVNFERDGVYAAYPKQRELAAKLKRTRQITNGHIKTLSDLGYITIVKNFNLTKNANGNVYLISLDKILSNIGFGCHVNQTTRCHTDKTSEDSVVTSTLHSVVMPALHSIRTNKETNKNINFITENPNAHRFQVHAIIQEFLKALERLGKTTKIDQDELKPSVSKRLTSVMKVEKKTLSDAQTVCIGVIQAAEEDLRRDPKQDRWFDLPTIMGAGFRFKRAMLDDAGNLKNRTKSSKEREEEEKKRKAVEEETEQIFQKWFTKCTNQIPLTQTTMKIHEEFSINLRALINKSQDKIPDFYSSFIKKHSGVKQSAA